MARLGTFDGDPGWFERGCLASFVRHGHSVTLYSYDPIAAPPGVEWADAATILPRDRLFRMVDGVHRGSVSAFSNLFRYAMIRATGLIWIDTDVVRLRPDWPDLPLLVGSQDQAFVNGAVLGARPDHPLVADAFAMADRIGPHSPWGYTGPHLLTALVHRYQLHREVHPAPVFYPIAYRDAPDLLVPHPGAQTISWPGESLCVHLWHEMLRLHGFDKASGPPAHSLLALLFAREG